jgi:hypothetical protein
VQAVLTTVSKSSQLLQPSEHFSEVILQPQLTTEERTQIEHCIYYLLEVTFGDFIIPRSALKRTFCYRVAFDICYLGTKEQ